MAQPQQSAVRNRLLATLAPEEFHRLAPALEPVSYTHLTLPTKA